MDLALNAPAATLLASARLLAGAYPAGIRAASPFPVGGVSTGPVLPARHDWTLDAASTVSGAWLGRDEQTAALDGDAARAWAVRVAGSAATSDLLLDSRSVTARRDADPRVWAALAAQAAGIGVELPARVITGVDPPAPPAPDVREPTKTIAVPTDDAASPAAPASGAAADAGSPPTPMPMTAREVCATSATGSTFRRMARRQRALDVVTARGDMPSVQPVHVHEELVHARDHDHDDAHNDAHYDDADAIPDLDARCWPLRHWPVVLWDRGAVVGKAARPHPLLLGRGLCPSLPD
ncbi:hypothetical protein AMAG_10946 [Allomyces macrogynus ATCC 38327]|uniref:Uncharacterized protein n=1 Tax=Allomyces macrogynus (strain ATCC 38327) TaxID=578462 RepID=A0A0L0SRW7_ALLM3|nr:hypothetical protein AMAG_10946 [Allomyces macrogynus ATCC 38327]|eukprot:KNE65303.1 hypothetical protein AMAG_10946 [Allomyces macrogynus ATCC 38327]